MAQQFTRRHFSAALAASALTATAQSVRRPNIVFILTDDQGYGDIAALGNPVIKTPNLDRLLSQSVRLTDYHVSPTCSPSRCALITGRHEFKSGVTHTIMERERMSLKATTIAQVLKSGGVYDRDLREMAPGRRRTVSAGQAGLRRGLHPRLRRDRAGLSRHLLRRARQHLLQPDHPAQCARLSERRAIGAGRLLQTGAELDRRRTKRLRSMSISRRTRRMRR